MVNDATQERPTRGAEGARSSARVFYTLIVAGVVLGALGCAATGWAYLEFGESRPMGRRVWDGIADQFVVPISAMIGATFGGLAGVACAVLWDARCRMRCKG